MSYIYDIIESWETKVFDYTGELYNTNISSECSPNNLKAYAEECLADAKYESDDHDFIEISYLNDKKGLAIVGTGEHSMLIIMTDECEYHDKYDRYSAPKMVEKIIEDIF